MMNDLNNLPYGTSYSRHLDFSDGTHSQFASKNSLAAKNIRNVPLRPERPQETSVQGLNGTGNNASPTPPSYLHASGSVPQLPSLVNGGGARLKTSTSKSRIHN